MLKDSVLPTICAHIPPQVLASALRTQPFCAYYHIVSDQEVPHVRHLYRFRSVKEFTHDLEILCRRFRVISLWDLLEHVRTDRDIPKNSLLLTFDDGFRECLEVIAPILLAKGIPATFFIISDCLDNKAMALHNRISLLLERLHQLKSKTIERQLLSKLVIDGDGRSLRSLLLGIDYRQRHVVDELAGLLEHDTATYLADHKPYLTSEQVRVLVSQGFTIGAHSIDHPQYSLLPLEEQVRQTTISVGMIRDRFSLPYGVFAFPHGDDRVSEQFFTRVLQPGNVEVTFGTAGIVRQTRREHFQRFSTENSGETADRVLGRYYARCVFKRITGARRP